MKSNRLIRSIQVPSRQEITTSDSVELDLGNLVESIYPIEIKTSERTTIKRIVKMTLVVGGYWLRHETQHRCSWGNAIVSGMKTLSRSIMHFIKYSAVKVKKKAPTM